MKKNITKLFFVAAAVVSFAAMTVSWSFGKKSSKKSAQISDARKQEVVVYTYDSFAGEWGPGPELCKRFKQKTGLTLTLVDCGDAIQAFNKAVLEKDSPQADVIIGIDNNLVDQAREAAILEPYTPKDARQVVPAELEAALGGDYLLTPFDYSHFAMIFDTQSKLPTPESLEDLTKDIYKKKIILMDPRTSTPGLGFLSWTAAVFGNKVDSYWRSLKPNILTMTSGWSEGWGMFLEGEAPLVISYTTSPAYNVEYDKNYRYKALLFAQGHVEQIEGYGLIKGAPNKEGAKKFMDFFISKEAQETLPLTQWMYPVNKAVDMPQSYTEAAPIPSKTLQASKAETDKALATAISIVSE